MGRLLPREAGRQGRRGGARVEAAEQIAVVEIVTPDAVEIIETEVDEIVTPDAVEVIETKVDEIVTPDVGRDHRDRRWTRS